MALARADRRADVVSDAPSPAGHPWGPAAPTPPAWPPPTTPAADPAAGYRPLPPYAPSPPLQERPRRRVPRAATALALLALCAVGAGVAYLAAGARGTGFVELRFAPPNPRLDRHEVLLAGEPVRPGAAVIRRLAAGSARVELRDRADGTRQPLCRVEVGRDRIATLQVTLVSGRISCAELRV